MAAHGLTIARQLLAVPYAPGSQAIVLLARDGLGAPGLDVGASDPGEAYSALHKAVEVHRDPLDVRIAACCMEEALRYLDGYASMEAAALAWHEWVRRGAPGWRNRAEAWRDPEFGWEFREDGSFRTPGRVSHQSAHQGGRAGAAPGIERAEWRDVRLDPGYVISRLWELSPGSHPALTPPGRACLATLWFRAELRRLEGRPADLGKLHHWLEMAGTDGVLPPETVARIRRLPVREGVRAWGRTFTTKPFSSLRGGARP